MENQSEQNRGIDFAASASKLYGPGGGGLDSYGPNYTQETGGRAQLHPLAFPDGKKPDEQAPVNPQTENRGGEPITDQQLQELNLDPADVQDFKKLNLNADQAKQVMELHKTALERQTGNLEKLDSEWLADLNATYGDQLESVAGRCREVLREHDKGGALTKILESTGYGNCAAMVKFLDSVSRSLRRNR